MTRKYRFTFSKPDDIIITAFNGDNAIERVKHKLLFYIPKIETMDEVERDNE